MLEQMQRQTPRGIGFVSSFPRPTAPSGYSKVQAQEVDEEMGGSYMLRKDTRKMESSIENKLAQLERWMVDGQHLLETQAKSCTDQQWEDLQSKGDFLLEELEQLLDQVGAFFSPVSVQLERMAGALNPSGSACRHE